MEPNLRYCVTAVFEDEITKMATNHTFASYGAAKQHRRVLMYGSGIHELVKRFPGASFGISLIDCDPITNEPIQGAFITDIIEVQKVRS